MTQTVTKDQWLEARKELLRKEKEFTKLRDELSKERRELPRYAIDKDYTFETDGGSKTLAELFNGKSQLMVYHFMYGPEWKEGCPSCSFWADNFERISVHLAHRDIELVTISRTSLDNINAYKSRMGWSFNWVSSLNTEFNQDLRVSFTQEEIDSKNKVYNYETQSFGSTEGPGVSVFLKEGDAVLHTYSTFSRGLDMLNGAYHFMDIAPKGRDEGELPFTMAWLRRRDQYDS